MNDDDTDRETENLRASPASMKHDDIEKIPRLWSWTHSDMDGASILYGDFGQVQMAILRSIFQDNTEWIENGLVEWNESIDESDGQSWDWEEHVIRPVMNAHIRNVDVDADTTKLDIIISMESA